MAKSSGRGRARGALVVVVLALALGAVACGSDGDGGSGGGGGGSDGAAGRLDSSDAGGGDGGDATETTQDPNCDGRGWSDAEPTAQVDVAMAEYSLTATPAAVPAGTIELTADNEGHLFHELVVVKWDGDPAGLPRNDAGGADQMQFRDAEVGRIFDFVANTSCAASFDLEPGSYALICNLVDDGFNPHYSQGMYTTFTVT
jgi:hypothetical protein